MDNGDMMSNEEFFNMQVQLLMHATPEDIKRSLYETAKKDKKQPTKMLMELTHRINQHATHPDKHKALRILRRILSGVSNKERNPGFNISAKNQLKPFLTPQQELEI